MINATSITKRVITIELNTDKIRLFNPLDKDPMAL
jgi:hypothetical protein